MISRNHPKPSFDPEIEISRRNYSVIAGVDEVGRGCIAGPIIAGAVVYNNYRNYQKLADINDSKLLTEKQRLELDTIIKEVALDYAIGIATVEEIDQLGIGSANIIAFKRAIDNLKNCDFALIDGSNFRGFSYNYQCIPKGDSKSISIASASIIAKVYRDNLMKEIAEKVCHYDLENNKGYGSKKHFAAIEKYGITEYHRRSFLKSFFDSQSALF